MGFFDLDCLDLALSISELDLDGSGLKRGGSHGPRWIRFEGRRKSWSTLSMVKNKAKVDFEDH